MTNLWISLIYILYNHLHIYMYIITVKIKIVLSCDGWSYTHSYCWHIHTMALLPSSLQCGNPAGSDQAQHPGPNPEPDTTRSNNNKSYINIYNNYLYIQVKNHKTFRLRTSYTECPGFLIYHIFTELSGEKAGRWLASVQTVVSTMMREGNLNQSWFRPIMYTSRQQAE